MASYFILVNEAGVYVKEANFFRSQGGEIDGWGKKWEPIDAESAYEARAKGIQLRRERYPESHLTMGEDGEAPDKYWPEAKGA